MATAIEPRFRNMRRLRPIMSRPLVRAVAIVRRLLFGAGPYCQITQIGSKLETATPPRPIAAAAVARAGRRSRTARCRRSTPSPPAVPPGAIWPALEGAVDGEGLHHPVGLCSFHSSARRSRSWPRSASVTGEHSVGPNKVAVRREVARGQRLAVQVDRGAARHGHLVLHQHPRIGGTAVARRAGPVSVSGRCRWWSEALPTPTARTTTTRSPPTTATIARATMSAFTRATGARGDAPAPGPAPAQRRGAAGQYRLPAGTGARHDGQVNVASPTVTEPRLRRSARLPDRGQCRGARRRRARGPRDVPVPSTPGLGGGRGHRQPVHQVVHGVGPVALDPTEPDPPRFGHGRRR